MQVAALGNLQNLLAHAELQGSIIDTLMANSFRSLELREKVTQAGC